MQSSLFPPAPPSGPPTDVDAKFSDDDFERYLEWKHSEDGKRACKYIVQLALADAKAGRARISVKMLIEVTRRALQVSLSNTFAPWIADDLVAKYPDELMSRIERRARFKPKELPE